MVIIFYLVLQPRLYQNLENKGGNMKKLIVFDLNGTIFTDIYHLPFYDLKKQIKNIAIATKYNSNPATALKVFLLLVEIT